MKKKPRENLLFIIYFFYLLIFIFIMIFLFSKIDLPSKEFVLFDSKKDVSFFERLLPLRDIKIYELFSIYIVASFLSLFYTINRLSILKGRINPESFSILLYILSFSSGLIKILIVFLKIYSVDQVYIVFLNKLFIFTILTSTAALFLSSLTRINENRGISFSSWAFLLSFTTFVSVKILLPNFDQDDFFYYLNADQNLLHILNVISILIVVNFYFLKKSISFMLGIVLLILSNRLIFFSNNIYYYLIALFLLIFYLALRKR